MLVNSSESNPYHIDRNINLVRISILTVKVNILTNYSPDLISLTSISCNISIINKS